MPDRPIACHHRHQHLDLVEPPRAARRASGRRRRPRPPSSEVLLNSSKGTLDRSSAGSVGCSRGRLPPLSGAQTASTLALSASLASQSPTPRRTWMSARPEYVRCDEGSVSSTFPDWTLTTQEGVDGVPIGDRHSFGGGDAAAGTLPASGHVDPAALGAALADDAVARDRVAIPLRRVHRRVLVLESGRPTMLLTCSRRSRLSSGSKHSMSLISPTVGARHLGVDANSGAHALRGAGVDGVQHPVSAPSSRIRPMRTTRSSGWLAQGAWTQAQAVTTPDGSTPPIHRRFRRVGSYSNGGTCTLPSRVRVPPARARADP